MYKIDRRGGGAGGSKNRILGNYQKVDQALIPISTILKFPAQDSFAIPWDWKELIKVQDVKADLLY